MNCEQISKQREVLLDYCAGTLEGTRAAEEFERHLAECGDCTRVVAAQREVWQSLDRLDYASVPDVSQDFDARLYARIAQDEAKPSWKKWLNRIFNPAVPVATWKPALSMAALCGVLAVGLMVRSPEPIHNTVQIVPQRVDIEQVANTLDELDLLMPSQSSNPTSAM